MVCTKKVLFRTNGPFWVQKYILGHPRNPGSALRIFLKFCRIKGASSYMKILLNIFREKKPFGAI